MHKAQYRVLIQTLHLGLAACEHLRTSILQLDASSAVAMHPPIETTSTESAHDSAVAGNFALQLLSWCQCRLCNAFCHAFPSCKTVSAVHYASIAVNGLSPTHRQQPITLESAIILSESDCLTDIGILLELMQEQLYALNRSILGEDLVLEGCLWHTSHFFLSLTLGCYQQICVLILHIATRQAPCVVVVLTVTQQQQQFTA